MSVILCKHYAQGEGYDQTGTGNSEHACSRTALCAGVGERRKRLDAAAPRRVHAGAHGRQHRGKRRRRSIGGRSDSAGRRSLSLEKRQEAAVFFDRRTGGAVRNDLRRQRHADLCLLSTRAGNRLFDEIGRYALYFGRRPCRRALAQAAELAELPTVVVDDRKTYANQTRFPHSKCIVAESFARLPDLGSGQRTCSLSSPGDIWGTRTRCAGQCGKAPAISV